MQVLTFQSSVSTFITKIVIIRLYYIDKKIHNQRFHLHNQVEYNRGFTYEIFLL